MIRWRLYRATSSRVSSAAGVTSGGNGVDTDTLLDSKSGLFPSQQLPSTTAMTAGTFPSPDAVLPAGLWDGVRPRVGLAGLPVRLDPFGVETGVVVVAGGERLLHHHRCQLPVLGARLVALVADRVADLVIDQILAVCADITLERHRTAHPAGLVDEHPRLAVGSEGRVEAGRLDGNLVAAALAQGHRRRQRHPEVRVAAVDPGEGELRVVCPTL